MPCRFCGGTDGDGHLFWECSYPPLVEIREHPEFHWLNEHGLTGRGVFCGMVGYLCCLELTMVPLGLMLLVLVLVTCWNVHLGLILPGLDLISLGAADRVMDESDVWTDGSLVQDDVSCACSAGAGFFAHLPGQSWVHRRIGHLDRGVCEARVDRSCREVLLCFLVLCRRFRGRNFWGSFLHCRQMMLFTWV